MQPGPAATTLPSVSDERLRELERAWRHTGSVDDEVAYLRERVRAGTLDERRLVNLYRRADGRVLTRDCPAGLSAGGQRPGVTMRGGFMPEAR